MVAFQREAVVIRNDLAEAMRNPILTSVKVMATRLQDCWCTTRLFCMRIRVFVLFRGIRFFGAFLSCLSILSCSRTEPLVFRDNPEIMGPWCAANQRVKIGKRVVGRVHEGDKWKDFLVDDSDNEYDPDQLAEQVWEYLEGTGDAESLKDGFSKDGSLPRLSIISLKPIVVILEPEWNLTLKKQLGNSLERYHWLSLVSIYRQSPSFHEDMQWFSPELKQRPIKLSFSGDTAVEILISNGRLRLVRDGSVCRITRE